MADLVFLDSNVLIYAISKHEYDAHKYATANRKSQEIARVLNPFIALTHQPGA